MSRRVGEGVPRSARLDAQSFAAFYRKHYDHLRYRLRVLARDDGVAEDLLADTMVLMWSRWAELDGTGDEADGFPRMRAYAYKTAHFKVRSHRRTTNNQVLLPTFDLEPCLIASRVDASSGVDFAETIDQIGRLPDQQRRTLALKLLGLDDSEVARTLGVGETTVRSNLTHARRKLTDYLSEWLPPGVCGGAR